MKFIEIIERYTINTNSITILFLPVVRMMNVTDAMKITAIIAYAIYAPGVAKLKLPALIKNM